jgi:hypothetical protein
MQSYSEEDIAAEEERIGAKLPDELRSRFLKGVEDVVTLEDADGMVEEFDVLGPSCTTSDKKGREYPTPGMHKETEEVRSTGEDFLPDDVVVAWGRADGGDLAVVLKDGSLAWWRLEGGEIVPAEIDWDPDFEEE